MAKLVNWYGFNRILKEKGIPLFSALDIRRLFGVSRVAATFLLHRYAKKGFIIRIKQGFYAFADAMPPEPLIANKIYRPSYLSLEFALSYHRVIPETVYEMTSITTRATRRFETTGRIYSYRSISKTAFTGYQIEKQQGHVFLIADPEKAFVDTCYFRIFDGLELLSRFDEAKIHPEKVMRYAKLFKNTKLINLIKEVLP